ncbi:MAG: hypothetical protein MR357_08865 [Anaeroplasma sp.]|nr:hypothetical protein [Anaeroplasma sp.]
MWSYDLKQLYYHSDNRVCGFVEKLYSENHMQLYIKLMDILCDSVKDEGEFFQYFVTDLLEYLKYIKDEYYYNKLLSCIDSNKSKNHSSEVNWKL